MKKLILLIVILAAAVSGAWAQQSNGDVYLKQVSRDLNYHNGVTAIDQDDMLGLFGHLPFIAGVQQSLLDASQTGWANIQGERNDIQLTQNGTNNAGIIYVLGDDNSTRLNQDGSGLLSILNIRGNGNDLDVGQDGHALQNYVQLTGSGMNFDINQNESGIRVTQSGPGGVPLSINTTGRSVPILIKNN